MKVKATVTMTVEYDIDPNQYLFKSITDEPEDTEAYILENEADELEFDPNIIHAMPDVKIKAKVERIEE